LQKKAVRAEKIMPEIESRIISGKGVLLFAADREKYRSVALYAEVIRRPTNEYLNFAYSIPRSRYATIQFIKNGAIALTKPLEYTQEVYDFGSSVEGQLIMGLQCIYAGMLQSYINLGLALGATPVSVTNCIEDWEPLDTFYDAVFVSCYSNTAVKLTLVGDEVEECCDFPPPAKRPQEQPDLPPPVIPPGTPLTETEYPYSPPYDNSTDGGLSIPFPGDFEPDVPEPGLYRVAVDVFNGSTYIDTGYTRTIATSDIPQIVAVGITGSNLATVTVFVEGEGEINLGTTVYNSACVFGFGTSSGSFKLDTARVEVSPCTT